MLLPWVWIVAFVPDWMAVLSVALFVPSALLVLRGMAAPALPLAAAGGENPENEALRRRCEHAERMLADMQQRVSRWSEASEDLSSDLKVAHHAVADVVAHIQQEVIKIGASFKDILRKTGVQMDCALRLLKSEDPGQHSDTEFGRWLSLTDYIHAYEEQLNAVTERMVRFSAVTGVVDEYEKKVRGQMIQVDELLDELRAIARQTSKLALESSVLVGNDNGPEKQNTVVSLTDKIRTISDDAHELTRRIRNILEGIKAQLAATNRAMRTSADESEREAATAKVEVAQLNLTMLEKTKEVRAALGQIGGLGKDIRTDIGKVIVAMQFQDITQQKLERVHQPVLSKVIQELRAVAQESYQARDEAGDVIDAALPVLNDAMSVRFVAGSDGNKVELF